jgi:SAM-dependent methyltransferase
VAAAVTRAASMTLRRIREAYAARGFTGVLRGIGRRLRMPRARSFPRLRPLVEDRIGIEIGGPSSLFARGGLVPLYPLALRVDECNFSERTLWDAPGTDDGGANERPGSRLIAEGGDLGSIDSGSYDFVLSSHMLEHTANPLRVLEEWWRVLRPSGGLILVVPHRDGTFDHRRPVTTLAHLRGDLERGTTEEDLTHLDEIVSLHDVSRDPGLADLDELRERATRNHELRSLHHHVFDSRLALASVAEAGFVPLCVEALLPYHVIVAAAKPPIGTERPLTEAEAARILARSPFPTDRAAPTAL